MVAFLKAIYIAIVIGLLIVLCGMACEDLPKSLTLMLIGIWIMLIAWASMIILAIIVL